MSDAGTGSGMDPDDHENQVRYAQLHRPERVDYANMVCSQCDNALMFSARQRGNGLCGPCTRLKKARDACTRLGVEWNEGDGTEVLLLDALAAAEKRAGTEEIRIALEESVKFQSHYAALLNDYDGGKRMTFKNAAAWTARLREIT